MRDEATRSDGRVPTVLVADDDRAVRALVRVTLMAQGWRVLEATTPDETLAVARRERPEIVLLDVRFEGSERDGFVVCRELRSGGATGDLRVVMLTARDDAESRAFASAVGATAYIVKPFGPLDLVRMLQLVLDQPTSDPGLGLFLVDSGVIQPAQLERALAEQRLRQGDRVPIGAILVELGFADRTDIDRAVARQRRAREVPSRAAPARRQIRLVIADDNPMVREGLRSAIATSDDLVTVGLASDGKEALRLVRDLDPDVIVLDHRMPGQLGLDVATRLRADSDIAVVMFTLDEGIREQALAAGVAAFVPKDTPLSTLLSEIRRVARPEPAPTSDERAARIVMTARGVSRVAFGALARRRRAIMTLGILLVAYAAAFLVTEPTFGAAAAILSIVPVAIAGSLFGPETGVVAALLAVVTNLLLWSATDHAIGEPIIRVGGNGLGALALLGIGGGFGAMRLLRGRFDPHGRRLGAIAEVALALAAGPTPDVLRLLAEGALEVVPGDAALLYAAVPTGGLELVAATGGARAEVGQREMTGELVRAQTQRHASISWSVARGPIGQAVPDAKGAIVVPIPGLAEAVAGVLVVATARRRAYGQAHVQALSSYATFIGAALNAPSVGSERGVLLSQTASSR
ncbi:MAG TPA: response regulator [Candidatus Limnocylindria bacterium]